MIDVLKSSKKTRVAKTGDREESQIRGLSKVMEHCRILLAMGGLWVYLEDPLDLFEQGYDAICFSASRIKSEL